MILESLLSSFCNQGFVCGRKYGDSHLGEPSLSFLTFQFDTRERRRSHRCNTIRLLSVLQNSFLYYHRIIKLKNEDPSHFRRNHSIVRSYNCTSVDSSPHQQFRTTREPSFLSLVGYRFSSSLNEEGNNLVFICSR